jgi:hypothetical protein
MQTHRSNFFLRFLERFFGYKPKSELFLDNFSFFKSGYQNSLNENTSKNSNSYLLNAIEDADVHTVNSLIKNGEKIDVTLLNRAITLGNKEIVLSLINEAPELINETDLNDVTPLVQALMCIKNSLDFGKRGVMPDKDSFDILDTLCSNTFVDWADHYIKEQPFVDHVRECFKTMNKNWPDNARTKQLSTIMSNIEIFNSSHQYD